MSNKGIVFLRCCKNLHSKYVLILLDSILLMRQLRYEIIIWEKEQNLRIFMNISFTWRNQLLGSNKNLRQLVNLFEKKLAKK